MENKKLLRPDGSDSDEVKEFELPPARSRRPRVRRALAEAKASGGPGSCSFKCFATLVVVAALSACVLLLGWLVMNMQRDINGLKQRMDNVESADHSNLKESGKLQLSVKEQLKKMKDDENKIALLDKKLKTLSKKIIEINSTVSKLSKSLQRKKSFNSLVKDVDQLQKGMADTDVKIERITDDSGQIKKNMGVLMKVIKKVKGQLLNITNDITKLGNKPKVLPTASSLKSKKGLEKVKALLGKALAGYEEKFVNKSILISKAIKGHELRMVEMDKRISITENKTQSHQKQLKLLKKITILMAAEIKSHTNSSDKKLTTIVNLLHKLSKNDTNMTADLLSVKGKLPMDLQTAIQNFVNSLQTKKEFLTTSVTSLPLQNVTTTQTPGFQKNVSAIHGTRHSPTVLASTTVRLSNDSLRVVVSPTPQSLNRTLPHLGNSSKSLKPNIVQSTVEVNASSVNSSGTVETSTNDEKGTQKPYTKDSDLSPSSKSSLTSHDTLADGGTSDTTMSQDDSATKVPEEPVNDLVPPDLNSRLGTTERHSKRILDLKKKIAERKRKLFKDGKEEMKRIDKPPRKSKRKHSRRGKRRFMVNNRNQKEKYEIGDREEEFPEKSGGAEVDPIRDERDDPPSEENDLYNRQPASDEEMDDATNPMIGNGKEGRYLDDLDRTEGVK